MVHVPDSRIPKRPRPPGPPPCVHKYVFKGTVYSCSEYMLPGSGAYARIYEDAFYCEKCLDQQYRNSRTVGNTYQQPVAGTMPK